MSDHLSLSEDERAILNHWSMWGSEGYPINKMGRRWSWGPWRGINGPPVVFKTKRAAVASFEAYIDSLIERSRRAALRRAQAPTFQAEHASVHYGIRTKCKEVHG